MKRNPLSPLVKKAFSCTLLLAALSLLFAACDYWGEDWYKHGESGTEAAGTTGNASNVLSYYESDRNGNELVGTGHSFIFDASGKLAALRRIYAFSDGAKAKAFLEEVKSIDGLQSWVSGNKVYTEEKLTKWYATTGKDDFLNINGVYFNYKSVQGNGINEGRIHVGYKKKDGSSGMTGRWYEAFEDGIYEGQYYDFNAGGSCIRHLDGYPDITGTWTAVQTDAIKDKFDDGEDLSFYDGYSAPVTRIKIENADGPMYLSYYHDGIMYTGLGEPFIPKPLP